MSELILVTGGARSGKSTFAENYLRDNSKDVLYIATAIPYDDEMKDRIKKHQDQRPSSWNTYEGYKKLGEVIENTTETGILIDCITIMVTNLMFDLIGDRDIDNVDFNKIEETIMAEIQEILVRINKYSGKVLMVTNELGSGIVPESKLGRVFRDIAGRVNQKIAFKADEVYLCVCGIPTKIKGGLE